MLAGCTQLPTAQPTQQPEEPLHVQVEETFELSGGDNWLFRTPAMWRVADEDGKRYLQMAEPPSRPMLSGVRRPQEYALYAPYEFRSFSLTCFVRADRDPAVAARDACIIFGRRDDTHFYYVHLAGVSDGAHNTVMRVDGATRQRLMPENYKPRPVMVDRAWHKVDVLRDCDRGLIQIFVDAYDPATAKPYFEVTDRTYDWGHLAVGSFDDHASFARILIEGEARKPSDPPTTDRAAVASKPE